MMNRTCLLLCAVFLFGVLSASAQSDSKTLFVRNCSLCHGTDGHSQTAMGKALKAADLTSPAVQSKTDAQLYTQIANGKGKMAGYEGILGKKGVEDMVKYVRTLAPPKK
jgi:mono/diheme cytochrome c family protein